MTKQMWIFLLFHIILIIQLVVYVSIRSVSFPIGDLYDEISWIYLKRAMEHLMSTKPVRRLTVQRGWHAQTGYRWSRVETIMKEAFKSYLISRKENLIRNNTRWKVLSTRCINNFIHIKYPYRSKTSRQVKSTITTDTTLFTEAAHQPQTLGIDIIRYSQRAINMWNDYFS